MKPKAPRYGSLRTLLTLSDRVKVEKTRNYQDSTLMDDNWRFTERHRVKSMKDAEMKMAELVVIVWGDSKMVDPEIILAGYHRFPEKGYFDVMFSYTKMMKDSRR